VAAYLSAFNTGDETAMRTFFEKNLAESALRAAPVDIRLQRYRDLRGRVDQLQLYRVVRSTESAIRTIFRSTKAGWLEFSFEFEPGEPHGLMRITVEEVDNPDQPAPEPSADAAALVAVTLSHLDTLAGKDEFSGTVLIAENDSVVLLRAYGFANREKKIHNRPDTRFNVGSINKSFTHVAILQLESRGKLALSDPIGKFLPDYPNREAAEKVTIEQLLTMSSGIGDFFGERFQQARKENIRTLKDYLPLFADKPLEFEPGTGRRYSNGGYIVLGLIIERVSGMDYYSYIRDNVFRPAGMSGSDWLEKSAEGENMARGYTTNERKSNDETLPQKGSSAGGGYSTAEDLLRYVMALRNHTLHLPTADGGLGIAGGAPGLNAALEWDPDTGYVIVVLSNFDPPAAERVAKWIRESLPMR